MSALAPSSRPRRPHPRHGRATLCDVYFTAEGRQLAAQPCPMTGHKHQPEPAAASVGTFLCRRCGAIPKDSEAYREDVTHPDAYDPYAGRA